MPSGTLIDIIKKHYCSMTNNKYPQFISNLPCGEDHTEGKSQEHLAVAIAEHIISTDSKKENQLSRIIGLKGEWGTGKSNVIKILDKPNEELQKAHNVLKQIKDGYHNSGVLRHGRLLPTHVN